MSCHMECESSTSAIDTTLIYACKYTRGSSCGSFLHAKLSLSFWIRVVSCRKRSIRVPTCDEPYAVQQLHAGPRLAWRDQGKGPAPRQAVRHRQQGQVGGARTQDLTPRDSRVWAFQTRRSCHHRRDARTGCTSQHVTPDPSPAPLVMACCGLLCVVCRSPTRSSRALGHRPLELHGHVFLVAPAHQLSLSRLRFCFGLPQHKAPPFLGSCTPAHIAARNGTPSTVSPVGMTYASESAGSTSSEAVVRREAYAQREYCGRASRRAKDGERYERFGLFLLGKSKGVPGPAFLQAEAACNGFWSNERSAGRGNQTHPPTVRSIRIQSTLGARSSPKG